MAIDFRKESYCQLSCVLCKLVWFTEPKKKKCQEIVKVCVKIACTTLTELSNLFKVRIFKKVESQPLTGISVAPVLS